MDATGDQGVTEACNFISEITVRVLLGAAVEPDDLPALKNTELGEVVMSTIDLSDAPHVWQLGLDGAWQAGSKFVVRKLGPVII